MIYFILSPILLLVLYSIGIQYERKEWYWKPLVIFLIPGLFVDIFVNIFHVTILTFDRPFKYSEIIGKREITVSDRLERFCEYDGVIGSVSLWISLLLNRIAPSGVHIRNAVKYRK